MITAKDLIAINREFHRGRFANKNALDLALDYSRRTRNWIKALAMVVRAILDNEVFLEANRETAAALIMAEARVQGFDADRQKVARLIERSARRDLSSIKAFEQAIKDSLTSWSAPQGPVQRADAARRIVREHPELFEAIADFAHTGRMSKLTRKAHVDLTIDADLLRQFRHEARKRGVKMSQVVEGLVQGWMRE